MVEKLSNVSDMIDSAIHKSRRLKEGILKADWEKIVGKICEKCQPDFIKEGILYIKVESPVFIHHFTFEKNKYIKLINDYFNETVIKDIMVKTGKLDENREEYLLKNEKKVSEIKTVAQEKSINLDIKDIKTELNIPQTTEINFNILEKVAQLQKMAIEREKYLLANGYKKCPICSRLYEGEENFCKICIDSGEAKKYLINKGILMEDED